uniref:BRCT domain-containing protein n=1 Tax=Ditylenchus dipsaci TaxID=166011 RepID=A0A915D982_9BILA
MSNKNSCECPYLIGICDDKANFMCLYNATRMMKMGNACCNGSTRYLDGLFIIDCPVNTASFRDRCNESFRKDNEDVTECRNYTDFLQLKLADAKEKREHSECCLIKEKEINSTMLAVDNVSLKQLCKPSVPTCKCPLIDIVCSNPEKIYTKSKSALLLPYALNVEKMLLLHISGFTIIRSSYVYLNNIENIKECKDLQNYIEQIASQTIKPAASSSTIYFPEIHYPALAGPNPVPFGTLMINSGGVTDHMEDPDSFTIEHSCVYVQIPKNIQSACICCSHVIFTPRQDWIRSIGIEDVDEQQEEEEEEKEEENENNQSASTSNPQVQEQNFTGEDCAACGDGNFFEQFVFFIHSKFPTSKVAELTQKIEQQQGKVTDKLNAVTTHAVIPDRMKFSEAENLFHWNEAEKDWLGIFVSSSWIDQAIAEENRYLVGEALNNFLC